MPSNLLGEFLGTMFLIILGDGVVANVVLAKNKGNASGWIVITTGWAMAVMVGVFIAISAGAPEADINPAVTIGKWLVLGVYTAQEAILTMIVQVIGAFFGAIIVWLAYMKLGAHSRRRRQAGRFQYWPRDPQHCLELRHRAHRYHGAVDRRWRDLHRRHCTQWPGGRPWAVSGRHAGLGHRPLPRRPDGIRHQPGS